MARSKLDLAALQSYLTEGHSQADAARHFGVSQAAISLRVRRELTGFRRDHGRQAADRPACWKSGDRGK